MNRRGAGGNTPLYKQRTHCSSWQVCIQHTSTAVQKKKDTSTAMSFSKKTLAAGFTLAFLLISFGKFQGDYLIQNSYGIIVNIFFFRIYKLTSVKIGAEAYPTVPCPLVTTMDCITDQKCKACCIDAGYDDGTCNGYLWACVCSKHKSPAEKDRSAEEKPVPVGLRRMGMSLN